MLSIVELLQQTFFVVYAGVNSPIWSFCRAESNPNVSGKDSTSSVASFGSEGSSESSDDSDGEGGAHLSDGTSDSESDCEDENYVSFRVSLFPHLFAQQRLL